MTSLAAIAKDILAHVAHFVRHRLQHREDSAVSLRVQAEDVALVVAADIVLGLGIARQGDAMKFYIIRVWKAPAPERQRSPEKVIGVHHRIMIGV